MVIGDDSPIFHSEDPYLSCLNCHFWWLTPFLTLKFTIFDVFLPRRDIGWRRDSPNQDWIPESSPNEGHYEP